MGYTNQPLALACAFSLAFAKPDEETNKP